MTKTQPARERARVHGSTARDSYNSVEIGIFVGAATALPKRFLVIFLRQYLNKYVVSKIQW